MQQCKKTIECRSMIHLLLLILRCDSKLSVLLLAAVADVTDASSNLNCK